MPFFVALKITPNASQNQVLGWKENVLCLRIRGIPEKGRVNDELIAFLSEQLGIAKSRIEITRGHTSRLKRVKIEGVTEDQFRKSFPPQREKA